VLVSGAVEISSRGTTRAWALCSIRGIDAVRLYQFGNELAPASSLPPSALEACSWCARITASSRLARRA
jgi:hypothetical protein